MDLAVVPSRSWQQRNSGWFIFPSIFGFLSMRRSTGLWQNSCERLWPRHCSDIIFALPGWKSRKTANPSTLSHTQEQPIWKETPRLHMIQPVASSPLRSMREDCKPAASEWLTANRQGARADHHRPQARQ